MTSIQLLKSVILAFQRTDQPSSVTSSSAIFSAGDRPATPQQGHSGRSDKDIAAGFRALRPSYQSQSAPKQSAATSNSMEVQQGQPECRGDLFAIMSAFTRPDLDQNDVAAIARAIDPPDRPWDARRLAFLVFLIFAVGGASALLSRAMLRPSTNSCGARSRNDSGTPASHSDGTIVDPRRANWVHQAGAGRASACCDGTFST